MKQRHVTHMQFIFEVWGLFLFQKLYVQQITRSSAILNDLLNDQIYVRMKYLCTNNTPYSNPR